MTLGKSLDMSEPQRPHKSNRDVSARATSQGFSKDKITMHIKCSQNVRTGSNWVKIDIP